MCALQNLILARPASKIPRGSKDSLVSHWLENSPQPKKTDRLKNSSNFFGLPHFPTSAFLLYLPITILIYKTSNNGEEQLYLFNYLDYPPHLPCMAPCVGLLLDLDLASSKYSFSSCHHSKMDRMFESLSNQKRFDLNFIFSHLRQSFRIQLRV
jgi:hypothetical protein